MTIDQETLAAILQLGGQYFLPIAALLRALYSGMRGRMPEGTRQIALAAMAAGISAGVSGEQTDLAIVIKDVLSNTAFTAGLLAFIVLYLLRMENRGLVVDGIVGGVIGVVIWLFTVYVLQQPWPWWLLLLIVPACAAGFIGLRFALRQIIRVVRIATYFLVIGLILAIGAGAFLLFQTLTQSGAVGG